MGHAREGRWFLLRAAYEKLAGGVGGTDLGRNWEKTLQQNQDEREREVSWPSLTTRVAFFNIPPLDASSSRNSLSLKPFSSPRSHVSHELLALAARAYCQDEPQRLSWLQAHCTASESHAGA